jgi:threonylcarbamoyladenosine tRNA methylthiotransferase MtaB
MKRRYKRELYTERVAKIKSLMPDCCIGVDVIVGHPGETRELFEESYNFLNELDISYLHVFTYSERENTAALEIRPIVQKGERAERSKMLHILSEKKKRFFYEQQIGKQAIVLFEDEIQNGQMLGFTENYVRVAVKYDPLLINETKEIVYDHINGEGLMEVTEIEEVLVH